MLAYTKPILVPAEDLAFSAGELFAMNDFSAPAPGEPAESRYPARAMLRRI